MIELNHVYEWTPGPHRTIVVQRRASYWDFWEHGYDGLHIRDWTGEHSVRSLHFEHGSPVLIVKGASGLITIRGKVFRESHAFYDVEHRDREIFPPQKRRLIPGLRQITLFRDKDL